MNASINAMCGPGEDIEDRIFELLGEMKIPQEIVHELGLEPGEGYALIRKVVEERDTPNGIRIREGIERYSAAPRLVARFGRWGLLQWGH